MGFSGSDDEVHFNGEGVAGWGGRVAGARRFFVKAYDDGDKFGGIKHSRRPSLLKDERYYGFIIGKSLTIRQQSSRSRGLGTTKSIPPYRKRSTS